ncbi:MAG: hydrogenase formation protein HypD [Thermodesulfovibrionales bacterium]
MIRELAAQIHEEMRKVGRTIRLMEVCGTHTVAIFRHGIRSLLPDTIRLLSGPGCPVCVTAVRDVDTVIALSREKDVVITTFGDMMRVPGDRKSLSEAKAEGSDIRIVYSPLDALAMAEQAPGKKVVFFATGFETTSPLVAATLSDADRRGIRNFYIYSVHKTVPPALRALLSSGEVMVDGFILPGHVSTIIGVRPYGFLASEFRTPSVVTGFDAQDILASILMLVRQVAGSRAEVENQYVQVVKDEGNPRAVGLLHEYFEPADAYWRGIGSIPQSGLGLRERFRHRDILASVVVDVADGHEPRGCSCGDVLKGVKVPTDCPLFGKGCTPEKPVGACMVSTEGSCAAFYRYAAIG